MTRPGLAATHCFAASSGLAPSWIASITWPTSLPSFQPNFFRNSQTGLALAWHIGLIVPVGFALVFIRFAEILVRILRNRQTGLGLADEAADALKLTEHEEPKA